MQKSAFLNFRAINLRSGWISGWFQLLLGTALVVLLIKPNEAQELEPRRWSHLPTGVSFASAGYVYTTGDINFDPTLQIEQAQFEQKSLALSALHTGALWGKPLRLELTLPSGWSRWKGLLAGEPRSVTRQGLRDASFRLSMNVAGAPVLSGPAFAAWQAEHPVRTTTGIGLQVTAPSGEYLEDKLLNLGGNRWVVRPQLGLLHTRHDWQFELTGSVSFYGNNDDFLVNDKQATKPLFFAQGHVIRTFRPGLWASASWGVTDGGENQINGIDRNDPRRESYWALSLGFPINRQQGIKLAWVGSRTHQDTGFDSRNLLLGWSLMFSP